MPLNSAIPLGVRPVETPDPMAQYAQVMGIQNAMNQGRLANLQYSETVKGIQEKDQLKNAMRGAINPDGSVDPAKMQSAYMGAGDPTGYLKLQQSGLQTQKAGLDVDAAKFGQAQAQMEQIGNMAAGMTAENYPQIRSQLVGAMPKMADAMPEAYPGDQWRDMQVLHMKNATGMLADKAKLAGSPFNPDGTPNLPAQQFNLNKSRAGASQISVQLPGKGLEGLQGVQNKDLENSSKSAHAASDTIASVNHMREAMASGMYAGAGAGVKAGITDFLTNGLGLPFDTSKLSGTREFTSAAGAQLLAHAKELGVPSNADAARIETIVGSIDTDPNAMKKVMDWSEEMARKAIANHNNKIGQVESYAQKNNMPSPFAYDLRVPAPEPWKPNTQITPDRVPAQDPLKSNTQIAPDRVLIINPYGKKGTIPRADLPDLIQRGGRVQ